MVFALSGFSSAFAQNFGVSVNNAFQYGYGTESGFFGEEDKEYLENFSDVRLFSDNVTIGFRLELRQPAEFGPDEQGITRRYIQFERDGLTLRAGDLFGLFNRGLSLNLFEDRVIRFDTSLDGLYAEYDTDYFRAKIIGGEINYLEQLTFDDPVIHEENHSIRGANLELKPHRAVRLGGSFVRAVSNIPEYFNAEVVDTVTTHVPEVYGRFRLPFADISLGYAHRFAEYSDSLETEGGAFYTSIAHFGSGYGLTLEYKNYRYNIADPLEEFEFLRPNRMLPFQNPPIAHKQHSYTLMSREPHLVNFNDEVGLFLDAFYSFSPRVLSNASFAWASRNFAWDMDPDTFEFERSEVGTSWLPSFDEKRSPFWEVYVDTEYMLPDFLSYVKAGYNYRSLGFYSSFLPESSYEIKQHNMFVELQYSLTPVWSIKAISEHQFEKDGQIPLDPHSYSKLLTLQVSKAPSFSVTGRMELTNSDYDPSGDKSWFALDASYRIGRSHTVSAGYGSERGGAVCINGVCRIVNAFEGFRFSLVSVF